MIYCTSDLHGKVTVEEFERLLSKAGFNENRDFLFVLGDTCDRGEHGVDLLRYFMCCPFAEMLLGNHDAMLLSCSFLFDEVTEANLETFGKEQMEKLTYWMENGAEPTLRELRRLQQKDPEICRDIVDFLREAPLYETVSAGGRDFLLCHAGPANFDPKRKLGDYTPDEWITARPHYDDRFFEKAITVFGHTPTIYYGREHKNRILRRPTWIDIDTGDATALLRLDDLAEFYLE